MDSSSLKGVELGKLVLSSGLLESSWKKISANHSALGFKIHKEEEFVSGKGSDSINLGLKQNMKKAGPSLDPTQHQNKTKQAPRTCRRPPPISRNSSAPTTLPGSQIQNPLQFLCSKKFPSFSVHTPAFKLFISAYNENLTTLKSELLELLKSKPVIITGAALGGSVASLFTLWLLETIDPKLKLKRPLCITFGSPLIGDTSLQQILENSVRSACFLHVAYAAKNPISAGFMPIGTFLICSGSECVCIEDPEAVMELLLGGSNTDLVDYGEVLHLLDQSVLSMADSRLISDHVINGMKKRAEKKQLRYDPAKQLNRMKVLMARIEKYKKESKKAEIGYYDQYRSKFATAVSIQVQGWKKELNLYWKSLVEEVEKKPQSDIAFLSRRFLFSANNYRRLVQPLDIAEYYREGGTKYQTSERSSHYDMLEKWFKDASLKPARSGNKDLSDLLTFDSCFWAEVEEAMILIDKLKAIKGMRDNELIGELVKFEEYVWGMIEKREVSPEIFLEHSSFMSWWKEYEKMEVEPSRFTEYMKNESYKDYGQCIAA